MVTFGKLSRIADYYKISAIDFPLSGNRVAAIYDLRYMPLHFDINTFFARFRLERYNSKRLVILYFPIDFPAYQYQRGKIFFGMKRALMYESPRNIEVYLRRLAGGAKIFGCEVECVGNITQLVKILKTLQTRDWCLHRVPTTDYIGYLESRNAATTTREKFISTGTPIIIKRSHVSTARLTVTCTLRNQVYDSARNSKEEEWLDFFNNDSILKNFIFLIFNDAENPINLSSLRRNHVVCDNLVGDNLKKQRILLRNGLHFGSASGSSNILSYSKAPYCWVGLPPVDDVRRHGHPTYAISRDGRYYFDRRMDHQYFTSGARGLFLEFSDFIAVGKKNTQSCPSYKRLREIHDKFEEVK